MGEAKRRKSEIDELQRRSPEQAARWRQLQDDKQIVARGIDPISPDPKPVVAMVRALSTLLDEAKRTGNVDPPVTFLLTTINNTVRSLSDTTVACKKGCSHCCYTWVSVSAPEALFIAKIVKQRGTAIIDKVRQTHQQTKDYDFETRDQHAYACPLLEQDVCSIYDERPKACRLAASGDAEICARAYHNISKENIPMPAMYLASRSLYTIAMAAGLRHARLPYHAYEFNAALLRALEMDQAEQRWLSGEDIFADIHRDPANTFDHPQAQQLYEYAFSHDSP